LNETCLKVKKRIFFLVTDNDKPSGGRMMIYRLVDILVKHGYDAFALHQKMKFCYTWFPNATPVCYTYQIKRNRRRSGLIKHFLRFYFGIIKDWIQAPSKSTCEVSITKDDILVLPATRTSFCNEIFPGVPKISLSQGPYLLFQCGGLVDKELSVFHPDIKARITMSELNYAMHCLVFPKETVWNVPVFIDSNLYAFSKNKKRQIAYMPRRLPKDSMALINLLTLRGSLNEFNFVPIDGMNQSQVASVLKDSLIFLSFSHRDGFGLPPAEAMACGCLVIGYSGNGGDEFFHEDVVFKIVDGDLLNYVAVVEQVIGEYVVDPVRLDAVRKKASERILQTYSRKNTEKYLLEAWSEILQGCEAR